MRKISAHYIVPVSSPPLKNGIVALDEKGVILDVIDTCGRLRETEKLEYYNGIITPGFVLPCCQLQQQPGMDDPGSFKDLDSLLRLNGISGVGLVQPSGTHFEEKQNSSICYHTIIELCHGTGNDFDVFQSTLAYITDAWNEHEQTCSISCCPCSWFGSELPRYILEYISTHRSILILRQDPDFPLDAQITALNLAWNRLSEEDPENLRPLPGYLLLTGNKGELPLSGEQITVPGLKTFQYPSFRVLQQGGSFNLLKDLYLLQEDLPGNTLPEILQMYTMDAARAIFEEDRLGSIEPGKSPGLNLIRQVELSPDKRIKLKENSTLRVL